MSLQNPNLDPFEDFRREKKMRSLQVELRKRLESRQGMIMRMIEAEERTEVLERQIQREMSDFFEESTRLAANVLAEVAEAKAREISAQIGREMQEFFKEVMLRAEAAVKGLKLLEKGEKLEHQMETHLDRETVAAFGGCVPLDQTVGQESLSPAEQEKLAREEQQRSAAEAAEAERIRQERERRLKEESLLHAEPYIPEPGEAPAPSGRSEEALFAEEDENARPQGPADSAGMAGLLASLGSEPGRLKEAITALYRAGVVDRDQARSLFQLYNQGRR